MTHLRAELAKANSGLAEALEKAQAKAKKGADQKITAAIASHLNTSNSNDWYQTFLEMSYEEFDAVRKAFTKACGEVSVKCLVSLEKTAFELYYEAKRKRDDVIAATNIPDQILASMAYTEEELDEINTRACRTHHIKTLIAEGLKQHPKLRAVPGNTGREKAMAYLAALEEAPAPAAS